MLRIILLCASQVVLLISLLVCVPNLLYAQFGIEDQHDVKFVIEALESPISKEAIEKAREFDDQLMLKGEIEGAKIYLVTDDRSRRVYALIHKILSAMGEESRDWVVRVLDTNPPSTNAFVAGGKYIYVFTGLIKEASSDDELGFVLAHELGHSLLKHNDRAKQDMTNVLTGLAELVAAIASEEAYENVTAVTKALQASYSQVDEEEADAIATAIAYRAGFDPLRGADFFTREKRKITEYKEQKQAMLQQKRAEVIKAQAICQSWTNSVNNSWLPSQSDVNKANAICNETEAMRNDYNQVLAEYNLEQDNEKMATFYSSHPNSQNRVAAVAMLTDYLHEIRPLESLQQFQQSYRVMLALKQVNSVLLKPPAKKIVPKLERGQSIVTTPQKTLADELRELKSARDQDFITIDEYQLKRQQILERH